MHESAVPPVEYAPEEHSVHELEALLKEYFPIQPVQEVAEVHDAHGEVQPMTCYQDYINS